MGGNTDKICGKADEKCEETSGMGGNEDGKWEGMNGMCGRIIKKVEKNP